jgi:hypothetical protein
LGRAEGVQSEVLPVRERDGVQVIFRLNEPAYGYLIALDTNGTWHLCDPSNDPDPPSPASEIRFPPSSTQYYSLTEGPGLQAFVLVAASEPLPSFATWFDRLGKLAWTSSPAPDPSNGGEAWRYDGQRFELLEATRGPIETLSEVPQAFQTTCAQIRSQPGVAAVGAVAFPVFRRDAANQDMRIQGGFDL